MKELIQDYIEAYNTKNIPGMLNLLDDQIVFENVSNTSGITNATSKVEFQALALQSVNYFSERKQIIRFLVTGLDSAAVEIDYIATVAQDFTNGLECVWELKRTGSGVNFVVAKRQSHDQTVGATDRLPVGRNFAFFQSST